MLDTTEFQHGSQAPSEFAKGERMWPPGVVGQWQKNEFELVVAQGLRPPGPRWGAEAGLGVTLSPTLLDVVVGGFTTGESTSTWPQWG